VTDERPAALRGKAAGASPGRRVARRRLGLEPLEPRQLLAIVGGPFDEGPAPARVEPSGVGDQPAMAVAASRSVEDRPAVARDATVTGAKWSDLNGNGLRDADEPGLPGWQIFADLDASGQLDDGEPSAVTGADGTYALAVPDGAVIVAEVARAGWSQTFPAPRPPSEFDIELVFPDASLSASQQAVIAQAALRWSQIIVGDVPDFNVPGVGLVDDLRLVAVARAIDGVGGILGQAGPVTLRPGSFLPATGLMELDSADLADLEPTGLFRDLLLHEMGHALGFGTIWTNLGLLSGAGTADPRFTGAQATTQYNILFQNNQTSVPVENVGGPGTINTHWRESVFDNELMTGAANFGVANPLSRLTVASLGDLGYAVNLEAADPYTPPSAGAGLGPAVGRFVALDLNPTILRPEDRATPAGPRNVAGPGTHLLVVTSGQTVSGIDFGNDPDPFALQGAVWDDTNGNAVRDAGEPGLAGWTVFLDQNSSGQWDPSEPSTVTDASGNYTLTADLGPGQFRLAALPQPGWQATFPVPSGFHVISAQPGQTQAGLSFGWRQSEFDLAGTVWNDRNGDGLREASERGAAGVVIFVDLDQDGIVGQGEPAVTSDSAGRFGFRGLATGTYLVRAVIQPGWRPTFPELGAPHSGVVGAAGIGPDVDFGMQPEVDYGDAPAPYPTRASQNGASHGIEPGFHLGAWVDDDDDGQPAVGAVGDDRDDLQNDEDGVVSRSDLLPGTTASLDVTASRRGVLHAWVDFNADGDWDDAGERVLDNRIAAAGMNRLYFLVPAATLPGVTYARFRLSHEPGLGPTGPALAGEVEDYQVTIGARDSSSSTGAPGGPPTVAAPFANPVHPQDVSGDGRITALDALLVINELNARGARQLPGDRLAPGAPTTLVDVNSDGFLTPRDALEVINFLNGTPAGAGEATGRAVPGLVPPARRPGDDAGYARRTSVPAYSTPPGTAGSRTIAARGNHLARPRPSTNLPAAGPLVLPKLSELETWDSDLTQIAADVAQHLERPAT